MQKFNEEFSKLKQQPEFSDSLKRVENLLSDLKRETCIFYGAGALGYIFYEYLKKSGINVVAFCDTYKRGTDQATGLNIIPPEQLNESYKDAVVIISTCDTPEVKRISAIWDTLQTVNFKGRVLFPEALLLPTLYLDMEKISSVNERISALWDILGDDSSRDVILNLLNHTILGKPAVHQPIEDIYFDKDLISLTEDEVFVDAGFFTGDTSAEFIRRTNGKFKHIYGFEPDNLNREQCKLPTNNLTIIPKGLWNNDDILRFNGERKSASTFSDFGKIEVPVTSIDNYFANNPHIPTYIKMDIEGSEKQALLGAKNTIKKHKPKLAISVYHKPEDIYELPELILKLNNDYKLYLRHYTNGFIETVLYAI